MSLRDEPPRCCCCKRVKPDVKFDRTLNMALCNACWSEMPRPKVAPEYPLGFKPRGKRW